jgi:SAM-dependent methyltransferase
MAWRRGPILNDFGGGSRAAFLQRIRLWELHSVSSNWPTAARILELGAGTGWQARELARCGFEVEAVDLADERYAHSRVWSVTQYDGRHLPYPDGSFDAVFSSNVLEHVDELADLLGEVDRVLRRGGRAVHLVPSASWRFWTSVLHYPRMLVLLVERACDRLLARPQYDIYGRRSQELGNLARPLVSAGYWRRVLVAERHGARGNALWEMYGFSRWQWRRVLSASARQGLRRTRGGIYYSGNLLLGRLLPLGLRVVLSRLLGSSCHVYVYSRV